MKKKLFNFIYWRLYNRFRKNHRKTHKKEVATACKRSGITLSPKKDEDKYIQKWSKLGEKVDIRYYRFYSSFIGEDINIVPDDLFHLIIEPTLNNQNIIPVYTDKNYFEKLLPSNYFPTCILRNIEYDFYDKDYNFINMDDETFNKLILKNVDLIKVKQFIVKPTSETGAGSGVRLFKYNEGKWISTDGEELSLSFLNNKYRSNYVIQKCIIPSDFVKQFNPSSFNTFRIITYRSIKDNKAHFLGGYMRVGAKDSFKDNVWGGGFACAINADGTLSDFASDSNRTRYEEINGISLKNNKFVIPNWDKILSLVYSVAEQITPNRLINFDIILDENNQPFIIEFNTKWQTVTTLQTLKSPYFGTFTDEVIDYCSTHKNKISYSLSIRQH